MHRRESSIERRITQLTAEAGGYAFKQPPKGWPDRMILLPGGRLILLEIKRPGGVVSRHQTYWIHKLRNMGFRAEVVDSVEQFERILNG